MAKLADLLEQVNRKEASIAQLREAHNDEYTHMGTVAEDAHKGDWMNTKDALVGSTVEEKVADFQVRTEELQTIGQFLEKHDKALAAHRQLRQPTAPPAGADTKQSFVGDRKESGPPLRAELGSLRRFAEKMMDTGDFKTAFASGQMPPMGAKELVGDRAIQIKQPMSDAIQEFKFFTITTPLPTDVVALPYPMRVQPLDYINMVSEPGAIKFFHRPEAPTTSAAAPTRARGATLTQRNVTWDRVTLTKRSLGNWMPIAHEDINDNAGVMAAAAEQLMVDVKYQIVYQLFQGDNTGQNWDGLDRQLATGSGLEQNTSVQAGPTGTPPAINNPDEVHPLQAINEVMTRIWERGMFPTVIFCNRTDYIRIRAQQRIERYLQPDYKTYPMGDVDGVPLCLTDQLPANTLIVADTDPRNMEIVMGQDIVTAVSDDFMFADNERSIRIVCYGNFALYRPLAAWKLTSTNNFRVIREN